MNQPERSEMQRLLRQLLALTEGDPDRVAPDFHRPAYWPGSINGHSSNYAENTVQDSVLAKIANYQIKSRIIRLQFFPREMISEGGWVILLELFVSENAGRKMSITDACIASGVPATTALRHLNLLLESSIIRRRSDPGDKRREFIEFTMSGRETMRGALEAMRKLSSDLDVALLAD